MRSRAIRGGTSRSLFSGFAPGCICSHEVEDENDDEDENDWGSGGGGPSIAGIVCLKVIDQSGSALLQHARFLIGFLLLPQMSRMLVLVLDLLAPLAQREDRERRKASGRSGAYRGYAFVRVYGRDTPERVGARTIGETRSLMASRTSISNLTASFRRHSPAVGPGREEYWRHFS